MIAQGPTCEQRAMEYYKLAAEFLDVYGKLSKSDEEVTPDAVTRDLRQASVKQLLLGHALELVMKGWLVLYEGNPISLTKQEKRALAQQGLTIPITLKEYGHDLEKLAVDAVQYDISLQPYLDKTIPFVDEQGNPQKKSIIEHLNSSYWGDGIRQYEYPEAYQSSIAFLSPLDTFAKFISTSQHNLLNAIMQRNGGTVPVQYRIPPATSHP